VGPRLLRFLDAPVVVDLDGESSAPLNGSPQKRKRE